MPLPQIVKTMEEGLEKAFKLRKEEVHGLPYPKPGFTRDNVDAWLTQVKNLKAEKAAKGGNLL